MATGILFRHRADCAAPEAWRYYVFQPNGLTQPPPDPSVSAADSFSIQKPSGREAIRYDDGAAAGERRAAIAFAFLRTMTERVSLLTRGRRSLFLHFLCNNNESGAQTDKQTGKGAHAAATAETRSGIIPVIYGHFPRNSLSLSLFSPPTATLGFPS